MAEAETSSVRLGTSEGVGVGVGSAATWTMIEQMGEGTMVVVYRMGVVKMVVVWVRVGAMGKA